MTHGGQRISLPQLKCQITKVTIMRLTKSPLTPITTRTEPSSHSFDTQNLLGVTQKQPSKPDAGDEEETDEGPFSLIHLTFIHPV